VLAVAVGCSAGDPPDPDAARADRAESDTVPVSPGAEEPDADAEADVPAPATPEDEEPELPEAEDATLDALEEQFEGAGVKDIRGAPGQPVTIRLEDDVDVAAAAAQPCAAVRAAGFADVQLEIDDRVEPCP
jgi:hypothetical protein